jgi:hypothetical protein
VQERKRFARELSALVRHDAKMDPGTEWLPEAEVNRALEREPAR